MGLTTDRNDPRLGRGVDKEKTGQHEVYLVLSDAERAQGFVRPVRLSYIHAGKPAPRYPLRELTDEERERYGSYGYIKFEVYPETESPVTGRFWSQADLDQVDKGCRGETRMDRTIAETYARDPSFYGATYCVHCGKHLPVEQFRWSDDGQVMGT